MLLCNVSITLTSLLNMKYVIPRMLYSFQTGKMKAILTIVNYHFFSMKMNINLNVKLSTSKDIWYMV